MSEIKCEENGGCPLLWDNFCVAGMKHIIHGVNPGSQDCHLSPADFKIIKAMIEGRVDLKPLTHTTVLGQKMGINNHWVLYVKPKEDSDE